MSSWSKGRRPITIAILAMGGEGGGVLSNWIVAMAEDAGYSAQNTSVAGVAQRTGTTIYYVELFPPASPDEIGTEGRSEPVLSTMPIPGEVDIVIASELMEAGRAIQRGFVTPDRTTLIASMHRVYSMTERIALGDGRVDSSQLLDAAQSASMRFISADFMKMAGEAKTVISASLFGALAGSGVLPFARANFEAAIGTSGSAAQRSLAAFAAGVDAAAAAATEQPPPLSGKRAVPVAISIGTRRPPTPEELEAEEDARLQQQAIERPESLVGPALRERAGRVSREFPEAARAMILLGCRRTALYQDLDYADRYLDRLARFTPHETDSDGAARLTTEAARHIALWMCYQDTIQVAFQKTRQVRLERVRQEAQVDKGQLVEVREFLHPQIDEITDTLPTALGRRLSRSKSFGRLVSTVTRKGLVINTTSIAGYAALSAMARVRPMRPRSLRFGKEQKLIENWLELAIGQASTNYELACETVECARVLKGYGATYEHGNDSFELLMKASASVAGRPDAAARLAALRGAALADEDGLALRARLAQLDRQ